MNWTRIRNVLRGSAAREEAEAAEELAFHVDMKARELAASGMTEQAARDQARRQLGNATLVREQVRETWSFAWLADAVQDLRYGARGLLARPGFTLAAVLALVLGIGVNAILFNVYNALALAPYAIRDAGKTVQVWAERGKGWNGLSWPEYRYLREHTKTLSGVIATTNSAIRVARVSGQAPWNGLAAAVSENYFGVIGTGFIHGRGFSPEAANAVNPAPEIVLQYDAWVSRFGGDPHITGEWIDVNGHQLRVVGIAARGFAGPSPVSPQAWVPGPWRDIFEPDLKTYNSTDHCCVSVIGRLADGSSRAHVQAELSALRAQFQSHLGQEHRGVRLTTPVVLASPKAQTQAVPMFLALAVTAGLILLLACANVANLQIARATARRREIAVRLAIGAGRGRVLRQMLVESLLLAAIAGAISIAIASWAPGLIVEAIANEAGGIAIRFDNDLRVIAFIAAVTLLAALISGFAPASGAIRDAVAQGLREGGGGRGATTGWRLRGFLLATQVALSAILVTATALMVRVADHARHIDPGFSYEDVILANLGLNSSGLAEEQARPLIAAFQERVRALPGVISVAHSVAVPLGNTNMGWGIRDAQGAQVIVGFDRVSAAFLDTLRVPLLAGRSFVPGDEKLGGLAIVNKAAAERLWPGQNPLGKPLEANSKTIVIGVAPNVTTRYFGSEQNPHMWLVSSPGRDSRLLIRHAPGAGAAILAALPDLARQQDKRFMVSAAPFRDTFGNALRASNIAAAVAAALGTLALLLACVGIYGVAAYNVSQRTREIGVRIALGARPSGIVAMVLRQNLRTVAIGGAVGMAGAMAFTPMLKSMLYGVAPADPVALSATLLVLTSTALLAAWVPARRAAGINPSITLRED